MSWDVCWDVYWAAGVETPSNHRSSWLRTTEVFLQAVCGQAILSLFFPPLFGLFPFSPPSSPPFSLVVCHQFVSRPHQRLPSQEEWRITASQIRKAPALSKPASLSLSLFILLLNMCERNSSVLLPPDDGTFCWFSLETA